MAGCRPDGVVDLVTAARLTVAAVGFSPGFAYLEGLPEELSRVPRRRRPRPVVPAGSIALANGYAAVYPSASPGGWQLIGRTAEPFFDARVAPYARLAPGDHVRFERPDRDAPRLRRDGRPADARPPTPGRPRTAGAPRVRGDPARTAHGATGWRPARHGRHRGAGRRPGRPHSFELANRLVGNPPDAVALEATAKGPTLRCLRPTFVAVVGAPARAPAAGPAGAGGPGGAGGRGPGTRSWGWSGMACAATWRSPGASSGPTSSSGVAPPISSRVWAPARSPPVTTWPPA